MVYRADQELNQADYDAAIRDRSKLIHSARFHLLPIVGELVVISTQLHRVTCGRSSSFLYLLTQLLFAITVVLAFNVAMLLMLLPLAPVAEAVSPTVASRLERAAAVGSVTTLLLATSLLIFGGAHVAV